MDFGGRYFEELAVLADGDLTNEVILLVEFGVRLGDNLGLFLVGGQVINLVGDLTVFDDAVRGLDEPELVNAGVGRK